MKTMKTIFIDKNVDNRLLYYWKKTNNLRNEMDELCVVVDLNNLFGIKNYRNETDERAQ